MIYYLSESQWMALSVLVNKHVKPIPVKSMAWDKYSDTRLNSWNKYLSETFKIIFQETITTTSGHVWGSINGNEPDINWFLLHL